MICGFNKYKFIEKLINLENLLNDEYKISEFKQN